MPTFRPGGFLVLAFVLAATPATAQYTWTGASSDKWSDPNNWAGGVPPAGGPDVAVAVSYTVVTRNRSAQDVATTFQLNALSFAPENGGPLVYGYLSGGFEFKASGAGAGPTLTHDATGSREITGPITLTDTLTLGGNGANLLTLSGSVGGAGGLVKSGTSLIKLAGVLSYTGGTVVTAGTLAFGDAAIPTGTIVNSATVVFAGGPVETAIPAAISGPGVVRVSGGLPSAPVRFTGANTYTGDTVVDTTAWLAVDADARLGAATSQVVIRGGTLIVGGGFTSARTFTLQSPTGRIEVPTGEAVLSGSVGGPGQFLKDGAGGLTLTGDNPSLTAIKIEGGTLRLPTLDPVRAVPAGGIEIPSLGVLAAGSPADATLMAKVLGSSTGVVALAADSSADFALPLHAFLGATGGTFTASGNLTAGSSNTYRFGGGTGTLVVATNLTGTAAVQVASPNSTAATTTVVFAGTNTYSGGTTVGNATALRVDSDDRLGAAGTAVTLKGGTLQAGAAFASPRPVGVTAASGVDTNGFAVTMSGTVTGSAGVTFTKSGAGTLTLTNPANALPIVTVGGGTLAFAAVPAAAPGVVVAGGATLDLTGFGGPFPVTSLTGSGTVVTAAGVTVVHTTASGTNTFSGRFTGAGALSKTGAATLVLSGAGANTNAGGATVSGGVLLLFKTGGAAAVTGPLTVAAGGTVRVNAVGQLVDGPLTLAGGTFATGPGADGLGHSAAVGPLALTSSSTLAFGTGSHTLTVGGVADGPVGVLLVTGWTGVPRQSNVAGGKLLFVLSDSPPAAQADFLSHVQFTGYGVGQAEFLPYSGTTYELVAVPEPATALALAAAGLAAAGGVRRRRQAGAVTADRNAA